MATEDLNGLIVVFSRDALFRVRKSDDGVRPKRELKLFCEYSPETILKQIVAYRAL